MKYLFFIILLTAVLITAGCVSENKNTILTPSPKTTPTIIALETSIPQTTLVSDSINKYKILDEVFALNTKPAYGFKIDYPSSWRYYKYSGLYPSIYYRKIVGGMGGIFGHYNFYSWESNDLAFIAYSDGSKSGQHRSPIKTWANETIKAMKLPYCFDGAGNPIGEKYCGLNQQMYYPILVSNDPIFIPGSFDARKLVFSSFDDKNYGEITLYLIYSGEMQKFNYTIPNRIDNAEMVDGPSWDFGIGGQSYIIGFKTPPVSSDIINHMITSFEIKR